MKVKYVLQSSKKSYINVSHVVAHFFDILLKLFLTHQKVLTFTLFLKSLFYFLICSFDGEANIIFHCKPVGWAADPTASRSFTAYLGAPLIMYFVCMEL
jgi:hypothetical protein